VDDEYHGATGETPTDDAVGVTSPDDPASAAIERTDEEEPS
jgi:hypothetical protein